MSNKAYLASGSAIKIGATQTAFADGGLDAEINPITDFSSQAKQTQPIGFEQIFETARGRLEELESRVNEFDFLVVLESGLVKINDQYFDIALCVIKDSNGRIEYSISNGTLIPDEIALEVLNGEELGPLLQQKYGIKEKDPAIYYTHEVVKRADILRFAVLNTISRFNKINHEHNNLR